ncbi:MAG: carbon-nitrogen hydrolase [candidate division KSB1 bacterium]|nr:carbon-nitrogen hydrolase [candidate division KSB1 bacterium]MDZ7302351.1 carbon-nitrogen hydrolase [candidate division KSB1 bacterium]MDZ7311203.1 carbon-nitrogen hydrolase [candidate division KSB1 bacterium]
MKLTLAIAQIDCRLADLEANLQTHLDLTAAAMRQGAQLIVFPELSLTGYHLQERVAEVAVREKSAVLDPLVEQSRHIDILFGLVVESPDHRVYNSALYLSGGTILHRHDKVYLPTYGLFEEGKYFARGDRFAAFDAAFIRCGILICEENWHPSAAHVLWIDGAKIFLSVHCSSATSGMAMNSPDLQPSTSPGACRLLSHFYARMFGAYFIFVNRVGSEGPFRFWGGSQIVNPFGQVEATAKYGEPELLIHELDFEKIRQARLEMPLRRDEDLALTLRELVRHRRY